MPKTMTIRERIVASLHGEPVDQIPFTTYPSTVPADPAEFMALVPGLGLSRRVGLARTATLNVKWEYHRYEEHGASYGRTTMKTPVGEVYTTQRLGAAYGSNWYVDHYIKGPDDYRAVEFMVRDTGYSPNYDEYHRCVQETGEDGYVSGNFGYSPLMEMRVNLLGMDRFATDRYDYPDQFWSLHEALREKQREAYPILAEGPAELVIYCGNCHPAVLGRDFARYTLPCYNELGEMLHARGKMLGCHLDANNAFWAQEVAGSQLDVIEAFTPAPDTDMSVADARAAWPDKVLWINYPSSLHLAPPERIREATLRLVSEAATGTRFIVGITEDIPDPAWRTSLPAIAGALAEAAHHE
jgi:hypothetical protein